MIASLGLTLEIKLIKKEVIFKNEYTIKNISKIVRLDRGSVRFVSTIETHEKGIGWKINTFLFLLRNIRVSRFNLWIYIQFYNMLKY